MRVREFIKKKGWILETEGVKRWATVDVSFVNEQGRDDETQFDIKHPCTKAGAEELEALFNDFCTENGYKPNTVTGVTVVKVADTLESL